MARPLTVQELIPELEFWVKSPTDPSLRKLLRKILQTLRVFVDTVGEPDIEDVPRSRYTRSEPVEGSPSLPDRIKDNES